ncbi:MAG: methionine aminotransferase, partial [Candidatus Raymondbacteria bacterium RifOxyC12_full_50_8]
AYDSYIPNIELNGAKAIPIAMRFPGYTIPWDEVGKRISKHTRVIIINSPHNPTGSVLRDADIAALRDLVAHTGIFIVSDEVYEHLIYDGLPHTSMLRYPDLFNRSLVCYSFGKTYSCTGWKLGYCVAPKKLMHEFRKVHQFNCFSCDAPKQVGLAAYLDRVEPYQTLGPAMQKKRDLFRQLLKHTPLKLVPSHGSYFECYKFGHFSQESDRDFALRLARDFGVAAIPVSAFYHKATDNRVIRFCFAKQESTLHEAAKRLSGLK